MDSGPLPAKELPGSEPLIARAATTPPPAAVRGEDRASFARISYSIRVQLTALVAVFVALPILLFSVLQSADHDRQRLLLDAVRDSGITVGRALQPFLEALRQGDFDQVPAELARFLSDHQSIKLLYKPNTIGSEAGFFYVASAPQVATGQMQEERALLERIGVLARLAQSCDGDIPLSERLTSRKTAAGRTVGEFLTSVTPIKSPTGCWAVVVAVDQGAVGHMMDGRPYWQHAEARIAGFVYAAMALLAFAIFAVVWSNLRRFKRIAAAIEKGASFEKSTSVPELADIGREFDAMVERLKRVADIIRQAAEDNAHAFKGPIAVIRQAVELVRPADAHGTGVAAITASLDRLDGLVQSARRIETATAELLSVERKRIDLTALARAFAADYRMMLGPRGDKLLVEAADGIAVDGREDAIETILENLTENAFSFTPPGGRVFITLVSESRGDWRTAVLTVADEGPGVHPDKLEAIFERYYSSRSKDAAKDSTAHFGIGLWLVKQNVLSMGGSVVADDRPDGGLAVIVRLPQV